MPKRDLKSYQEEILDKLKASGRRGLNKTSLKIGQSKPAQEALNELLETGAVVNLGTGKTFLYLLREFNQPLELAYEAIERTVRAATYCIFTNKEILQVKTPSGQIKSRLAAAQGLLVKEGKLVRLKGKKTDYFAHVDVLRALLPAVEQIQVESPPIGTSFNPDEVITAYDRLKRHHGFSNVEIYDLMKVSGQDLKALQAFLLDESRQGRAVLSLGDWSLSTPAYQSAAVYLNGKAHLLVRFKN